MKNLFLALLVTTSALASNWVPVSKIQEKASVGYQLESSCLASSGEQCLDVGDEPDAVKFISLVDDWSGKYEVVVCVGEEECQQMLSTKICPLSQAFIDQDFTHVYCSSLLGKKMVLDSAGFASYKAQLQAQEQVGQLIAMGAKAEADCKKVLHLVGGLNLQPGRTADQIDQMSAALEPIKQALQDGRPSKAKALITAMEPDGVLVTAQMKALVLSILKDW